MKIYTKKGDTGETSLFGGTRVSKHTVRIEAFGTVDELNSLIGMAVGLSSNKKVTGILERIQHQLFVLGADLSTPLDTKTRIGRIEQSDINELETVIDGLEQTLPDLKNFILPGGTSAGSTLHHARTVCRRAERYTVACHQSESLNPDCIVYLNRLSDLLFVLARYENHQSGQTETPWLGSSGH